MSKGPSGFIDADQCEQGPPWRRDRPEGEARADLRVAPHARQQRRREQRRIDEAVRRPFDIADIRRLGLR